VTIDATVEGGGTTGKALLAAATQANAWSALGTVPTANLPALAINDTFTVADQTARLALTAQRGDMAYQTDTSTWYILATDTPAVDANWKAISVPAVVQSVNGKTGAVALTASDVGVTAATTSAAGIVQLATTAEATTGTDTGKAVTSAGVLAGVNAGVNSLFLVESGSTYPNRPAGTGLRIYVGATAPTGGGTTAGGAGAVDGLDIWWNTGA
jgi:hypothetical protein